MTAETNMQSTSSTATSSPMSRLRIVWPVAGLSASVLLWKLALPLIDVSNLDDFGLVALFPWQLWLALAILATSFVFSLQNDLARTPLPLAHLFVLVAFLHLTPALIYENVRYPWVWKHIGMVDFIQRHGSVDRDAKFLQAYHNWPGLFYVSAWIGNWLGMGAADFANLSRYAPAFFETAFVLALVQVYRRLTVDLRIVWLAIWVFLCGNWIGQDYYSPQAVALLLYLIIISLCIGPLRSLQTWTAHVRDPLGVLAARFVGTLHGGRIGPAASFDSHAGPINQMAAVLLFAAAVLVLVATHQLTPIALILALSGLFAAGQLNLSYLLFAVAAELLWVFYFASPYVAQNLAGEFQDFGGGINTASHRLVDATNASIGKWWVVFGGRACALTIVAAAFAGGVMRLRSGYRDVAAAVLLLAPLPMIATSYGGEILFRVYMFALPFLAFFAATAIFTIPGRAIPVWVKTMVATICALLAVGFYFGDNGKDIEYTYSSQEIAASTWLHEHAAPGTLLIEGSHEYPSQFKNYENIAYLTIDRESLEDRSMIAARPAKLFAEWMGDPKWSAGYIILTRSQKISTEYNGTLPKGTLDNIEQALLLSPDFNVAFANADARIFVYNHQGLRKSVNILDAMTSPLRINPESDSELVATLQANSNLNVMVTPATDLPAEKQRLIQMMNDFGYLGAKLVEAKIATAQPFQFQADPGPIYKIRTVSVLGLSDANMQDLSQDIEILIKDSTGQPASAEVLNELRQNMLAILQDKARPFAKIVTQEIEPDPIAASANIQVTIAPGPPAKFGNIVLKGLGSATEQSPSLDVDIKAGEPFDKSRLDKLVDRLRTMPNVSKVRVNSAESPDSSGKVPVEIQVSTNPESTAELSRTGIEGEIVTTYALLALLLYQLVLASRRAGQFHRPLLLANVLIFAVSAGFAVQRALAFIWQTPL
jgi:hypothetical protein